MGDQEPEQLSQRGHGGTALDVGPTDLIGQAPLCEESAIGGQQARSWLVDVRGLRGDPVELEDLEPSAGPELRDRTRAQVEASKVETRKYAGDLVEALLEGWCREVVAVAEDGAPAVIADLDQRDGAAGFRDLRQV